MKLTILGSGGKFRTPRTGCFCKICKEARLKGIPYYRTGPSFYLDKGILFDTPEDIFFQINKHNISKIDHVIYSHAHPDHCNGYRIFELLKGNLNLDSLKNVIPIQVHMLSGTYEDFKKINPNIFFYEKTGLIKINKYEINQTIKIDGLLIYLLEFSNIGIAGFLIKRKNKKVILMPDHSNLVKLKKEMYKPDLLIMDIGHFNQTEEEDKKKNSFYKNNLALIKELRPSTTVLSHIEDQYGLSFDDYKNLEDKYKSYRIKFAFDGMNFDL